MKNINCKEHDCTKCIHAHLIEEHTWECDAKEYDIKSFTCYVPKDEAKA